MAIKIPVNIVFLAIAFLFLPGCGLTWNDENADASDVPDTSLDSPCPGGQAMCEGVCVDTSSNHASCGSCGHECSPAEVCSDGRCLLECPPGRENCSGGCVITDSDILNCGSCGHACPAQTNAEALCSSGVCATRCLPGWIDPEGDGSCNVACTPSSETCNGRDDDCDGLVDEDEVCACTSNADCGDNVQCARCSAGRCEHSAGADCGTCARCDDAGHCAGNSTDHGDCGFCHKCSAGTCVDQTSSEDLKNECAAGACTTGNCNGSGACTSSTAGSQSSGCNVCRECDGSGSCVNVDPGQQRPGCDAAATSCSGADACDGSGNCILNNLASGTRCGTCATCDESGNCSVPMAPDTPDSGCGQCKKCSGSETLSCTANRSYGCSCNGGGTCDVCDGSGTCSVYTCLSPDMCCCPGRCGPSGYCYAICASFPECT